jgi:hypothetical protein
MGSPLRGRGHRRPMAAVLHTKNAAAERRLWRSAVEGARDSTNTPPAEMKRRVPRPFHHPSGGPPPPLARGGQAISFSRRGCARVLATALCKGTTGAGIASRRRRWWKRFRLDHAAARRRVSNHRTENERKQKRKKRKKEAERRQTRTQRTAPSGVRRAPRSYVLPRTNASGALA